MPPSISWPSRTPTAARSSSVSTRRVRRQLQPGPRIRRRCARSRAAVSSACHPRTLGTDRGAGRDIIAIHVPRSPELHAMADGRVLLRGREGDGYANRPLGGEEIRSLAAPRSTSGDFGVGADPGRAARGPRRGRDCRIHSRSANCASAGRSSRRPTRSCARSARSRSPASRRRVASCSLAGIRSSTGATQWVGVRAFPGHVARR